MTFALYREQQPILCLSDPDSLTQQLIQLNNDPFFFFLSTKTKSINLNQVKNENEMQTTLYIYKKAAIAAL